jgi:5'-nucleotidase
MSGTDPTMHPTLSKRIALDMDNVMADTLTAWLERYNQDFGTRITKANLHGKRIYDFVGPSQAVAARAYLDHPDFFLELPLMEGSQMVIKRLTEKYEVFVTSAAMDHPNSFPAKYVWLKNISLSYRTRTLCSAGTKASSGQTS